MNRIFYIMGKSSSGKDTIYKRILSELELTPIVLYTTRPMRANEADGREYHFVDRNKFNEMKSSGEVIEYRIYNTVYGEWIYFTAKNSIDLSNGSCLGIGTLESYVKIKKIYGNTLVPVYLEVDDYIRLIRAIERERSDPEPKYKEMCRRFITDSEDFSEENLKTAAIEKRFKNNGEIDECIDEIKKYISELIS